MCCFAAAPHPSAALTPSPQGEGFGAGRICRGVVRVWEIVLHTSSVKNQRFLTASPQGEALGAVEEREVFLCCFAAAPHPSAALTPNELWSNRHRRSTYLYSLRSAAPSRGRLWCRTDSPESGVNSEILLRQSPSQKSKISDSPLYTRGPLGRCRAGAGGAVWQREK